MSPHPMARHPVSVPRARCLPLLAWLLVATLPSPGLAQTGIEEGRADLRGIFSGWDAWEEGLRQLDAAVARFAALEEAPLEAAADLLRALQARDDVHRRAARVEGYLHVKLDLDRTDEEAARHRAQMDAVSEAWNRASGWWQPRLSELGEAKVRAWLGEEPGLEPYRFYLQRSFRDAARALPQAQERLLDLADLAARQSERTYNALAVAQPPEVAVTLGSGERFEISPAGARRMLWELTDPGDRRRAQQAWFEALGHRDQAYAALLEGVVERRRFVARARGFDGALEAALWGDRIPAVVVDALLTTARRGSGPLRRYHRLRQSALGLERYGTADRFVPLRPLQGGLSYGEARKWILASAAPLGEEVQAVMRQAFEEGWIDAFERPGKRPHGGATYVYGEHPYVLVSFRGGIDELFQLAHELGHAVHSHLAARAQPFVSSHYSTLTGETVASVHEILLVEYLLDRANTPDQRIATLDFAVQNLLRLFYRTVLDADFELALYEEDSEEGRTAVTAGSLGELYRQRLALYYGETLELEPWDRWGWLGAPHFFTAPLYMLRYGLSYAAAAALADQLTAPDPGRREEARHRFLDLLRAGGSDDPLALLRRAGADLEDPETLRSVPRRLEAWVERLEQASAAGLHGLAPTTARSPGWPAPSARPSPGSRGRTGGCP